MIEVTETTRARETAGDVTVPETESRPEWAEQLDTLGAEFLVSVTVNPDVQEGRSPSEILDEAARVVADVDVSDEQLAQHSKFVHSTEELVMLASLVSHAAEFPESPPIPAPMPEPLAPGDPVSRIRSTSPRYAAMHRLLEQRREGPRMDDTGEFDQVTRVPEATSRPQQIKKWTFDLPIGARDIGAH